MFEQKIEMSITNEPPKIEVVTEFEMREKVHRIVANWSVLPVLKAGEYFFRIYLREKGQSNWGRALAEYPIEVVHIPLMQPQPQ